jgi:hypothetical protein
MLSEDDWRLHFTQWNHLITLPVRNIVDDQLAVGRRRILHHCLIREIDSPSVCVLIATECLRERI